MNVEERNEFARQYVTEQLDKAEQRSANDFLDLDDIEELQSILDDLINIKQKGFRGIVLTAIVGLQIDPAYEPLTKFYDANPRSIFEKGIFYALRGRVPSGKSDPLNVAKNANVIDETWARGKRPEKAAFAAVNYLRKIMSAPSTQRQQLIDFFFYRLWVYGQSVSSIKIKVPEKDQLSNQEFARVCNRFIEEFPENGTVPQFVIFKLIEAVYAQSSLSVEGGLESVFGPNTTSKKPADIWIENDDGKPINLFEVTVKTVDEKRLDDCVDSLDAMNILDLPVQFICRLPQDVASLTGFSNNTANVHGKHFDFQDIKEFVKSLSSLLSQAQIRALLDEFSVFISDVERPISTKEGWNKILSDIDL